MYRLHIIPLSLKNAEHELFTLQAPNLSTSHMSDLALNDILLKIKIPLASTRDIFAIHPIDDQFWSDEKRQFIRIVYYVSDFEKFAEEIIYLLQKNFFIDIFISQPVSLETFSFLAELGLHPAQVRFIIIENSKKIDLQKSIFKCIPAVFKSGVYFLYLPSSSKADFYLLPKDVLSRINDRRTECQESNESLKIISITNIQEFLVNPDKKIFYLNPIKENFLKYLKTAQGSVISQIGWLGKIQLISSNLLFSVTQKIVHLIRFMYWKIKHFNWFIEYIFIGATSKISIVFENFYLLMNACLGRFYVLLVKTKWFVRSQFATLQISCYRRLGQLSAIIIDSYWWGVRRLSITSNSCIQGYWKLNKMMGPMVNALVQGYWKLNKMIRLFANVFVQGYWRSRESIFLYPFFKVYWFVLFQFKKRVLSIFNKNKDNFKNATEKSKK